MFKPAHSLLQPDPRNTGMRVEDLHGMVRTIELSNNVPTAIRDQFDTARNAFAYSWFVYEFTMVAEQQCYFVMEMALRLRLGPIDDKHGKSPGLTKLLKAATDRGLLRRDDFAMPSMSGAGGTQCRLDIIPFSRNHLAHGNINLLPQYALMQIELTAEVLNKLFSQA